MRYYKLINKNGWGEEFELNKIYQENYHLGFCEVFKYATNFSDDWQEVPEYEYLIQEGIIPDYRVKGTKLPTIPENTDFRLMFWYESDVNKKLNFSKSNLVSCGPHKVNEEIYISADYEMCEGAEHYMFKLSDLAKLTTNEMKQEKKIVGYEPKADAPIRAIDALSACGDYYPHVARKYDKYSIKDNPGSIENFKDAGVLDLWFEPLYEEEKTLPVINGHEGKLEDNILSYGCADIQIKQLSKLYKACVLSANRHVKSITLNSDVTITIKEIKQILEYAKDNK